MIARTYDFRHSGSMVHGGSDFEDLDTVGFVVGEAARLLRGRFDQYARNYGVTRSQWLVLVALLRQEPVSQIKLATYLEVEAMSLCRMADRLQTIGLVERAPSPDDRRVKLLSLSPKAHALLKHLRKFGTKVMDYATADLSPVQKVELVQNLQHFCDRLKSPDLDVMLESALADPDDDFSAQAASVEPARDR